MFSDICINYAASQGVPCLHTIFPEALRKIPTFLVLFPVLGQEAAQESILRMVPVEILKSNSTGEVTGGGSQWESTSSTLPDLPALCSR